MDVESIETMTSRQRMPAHALDLRRIDERWSRVKYLALSNFVPDDVGQLYDAVVNPVGDFQFRPLLMQSFHHAAELHLVMAQLPRREE